MHFFEYLTNWRFHHITIIDARRTWRRRKWLRWRNIKIGTLLQKKKQQQQSTHRKQETPNSLQRTLKWEQYFSNPTEQETSLHSQWTEHSLLQWSGGKRSNTLGRRPREVPLHSLQYTAAIQSRLQFVQCVYSLSHKPGLRVEVRTEGEGNYPQT